MKKLKTLFSAKKIVVYLVCLLFILTVPNLDKPAMSQTEAIVTMMCVDKEGDKVKLSSTILTPGQDKQANMQVFNGEGATLGAAVDSVALALGKEMSFAQCEIMAIGDNLCDEGIMPILDYLTRTKKVGRNAILINCSGDIADFSQAVIDLSKEKNLKLSDIVNYDKRYILAETSNIELFYIGYFSDIGLGIMPQIKIGSTEESNAIEVGSGSSGAGGSGASGGSDSSTSSGDSKKYLTNDGTTNVFKRGKRDLILKPEDIKKLNLFLDINQKGNVLITDITDELYDHATVVVDLIDKRLKVETKFDGETPKYTINMDLTVSVEEVIDYNPDRDMLIRNQEYLTSALIKRIEETIVSDMKDIITFCRENEVDLIDVYKNFYRKENKKWEALLEQTGKEKYLDAVEFDYKVKVFSPY